MTPSAHVPALRVTGLRKEFRRGYGRPPLVAVDHADVEVRPGTTFGLIGESGSGKSTLARCVVRLYRPDAGSIEVDGTDITGLRGRALRLARRRLQLVFQDPYAALDPRMTVAESVAEPLRELEGLRGAELRSRVDELLDDVALGRALGARRPAQLSGGQCQRAGIARALAVRPGLLVLDEPTSALDVSVQAQVLNLLNRLQVEHRLTYLLITHDLDVVRHMADHVAVMHRGRIVESGPTDALFTAARDPYARTLLGLDKRAPAVAKARGHAGSLGDD